MSKYDEIVELAKQASIDIQAYQRESIRFVETLASECANYLEADVYLVSAEDAVSETTTEVKKTAWESMSMGEDNYWHFGLALILFPTGGQYSIPLFFKKVKDRYELHIANDRKRKTFWLHDLKSESFQPFLDYLFSSIKDYFCAFENFPESKPILGFNAARILKTSEPPKSD